MSVHSVWLCMCPRECISVYLYERVIERGEREREYIAQSITIEQNSRRRGAVSACVGVDEPENESIIYDYIMKSIKNM